MFQYLECNNRKDIEQIIAFKQRGASQNPCDDVDLSESTNILTWTKTWKQNECIEYMRKTANIETDYCLPDEVLIEFLSNLYAKVFEKYFVSTTQAFNKATEGFGLFGKMFAFGILMMFLIIFGKIFIGTTISSIFRYGFTGILSRNRRDSDTEPRRRTKSLREEELALRLTRTLEESQQITRLVLTQNINRLSHAVPNRIEDVRDEVTTDGTTTVDEVEEFEHIHLEEEEEKLEEVKDESSVIGTLKPTENVTQITSETPPDDQLSSTIDKEKIDVS